MCIISAILTDAKNNLLLSADPEPLTLGFAFLQQMNFYCVLKQFSLSAIHRASLHRFTTNGIKRYGNITFYLIPNNTAICVTFKINLEI